jgi:hypothetical protein
MIFSWRGEAGRGEARRGRAWRGPARQGKARIVFISFQKLRCAVETGREAEGM